MIFYLKGSGGRSWTAEKIVNLATLYNATARTVIPFKHEKIPPQISHFAKIGEELQEQSNERSKFIWRFFKTI